MRTSLTKPPQIHEVRHSPGTGKLGMMACPGKKEANAFAGSWLRDMDVDLDAIEAWNAATVVSLIEPDELDFARSTLLEKGVRDRHIAWHALPVRRQGTPSGRFEADWQIAGAGLRQILRSGGNVLLHSMTGQGRAAMIAARLLVELGIDPGSAVARVRQAQRGTLELAQQVEHVMAQRHLPEPRPSRHAAAIKDRALGAMLGGAVGDALGGALEFAIRDSFLRVTDMMGGGPFDLQPGEWSGDTAMMLALADSLSNYPGLDETDLMMRLERCHEEGAYSCTGESYDTGLITREALRRWKDAGDPIAGSKNTMTAGNGSLVRLVPIVVRHWRERGLICALAERQSRTTHAAPEAIRACIAFGAMLGEAVEGQSRSFVLRERCEHADDLLARVLAGSWRDKSRDQIESSAYVVYSLEAALWCVSRSASYEDAVLLAANLGQDADTICAITGQLAGALYGCDAIPERWLEKIAWRDLIEQLATRLFDQESEAGDSPLFRD